MKKVGVVFFLMFLFSNARSNDINELVDFYAKKENIDPLLVKSIIYHESRGNVKALSHVGAMGLMQLMPGTAKFVGVDPSKLYIPDQNIKAGVLYLSFLKRNFKGDVKNMVAAYNAGHAAVQKYGGVPPYRETINYTRNVLDTYVKYRGGLLPVFRDAIGTVAVDSIGNNSNRAAASSYTRPFLIVVDKDKKENSVRNNNHGYHGNKGSIRPSIVPATYVRNKSVNTSNSIRAVGNKKNKGNVFQSSSSRDNPPPVNPSTRHSNFLQIISTE